MEENSPLIITVTPDGESQAYFDELRQKHFPPAINYLKAHLTLFHHLPGTETIVDEALFAVSRRQRFAMEVNGIRHTGFGTAFTIISPDLLDIHASLGAAMEAWLIPQDRQRFQPHITVQNKVTPEASKQLAAALAQDFKPFAIQAIGLDSWWYRGGPWEHFRHYPFST